MTPQTPTLASYPLERSSSPLEKMDMTYKFMKQKVRSPSMPSFSFGFSEECEEPSQLDSPKLTRVIKPNFYKKSPFTDEQLHTLASPALNSNCSPPLPFSSWSDSSLPKNFVDEYKSFIDYDYRKSIKLFNYNIAFICYFCFKDFKYFNILCSLFF